MWVFVVIFGLDWWFVCFCGFESCMFYFMCVVWMYCFAIWFCEFWFWGFCLMSYLCVDLLLILFWYVWVCNCLLLFRVCFVFILCLLGLSGVCCGCLIVAGFMYGGFVCSLLVLVFGLLLGWIKFVIKFYVIVLKLELLFMFFWVRLICVAWFVFELFVVIGFNGMLNLKFSLLWLGCLNGLVFYIVLVLVICCFCLSQFTSWVFNVGCLG